MPLDSTAISRHRSPDLIPGYRLEALLGKGGMGEVYLAMQLSLGRTVAVKLLSDELAQDKTFVTRFEKEAAALATLSHPNIVAIVDKGKAGRTYYLVMELVAGPSLRELMRAPAFDATEALRIAFDICRAIDYAHGRGVMHRDLKPENILIDEQAGRIPKVSDFGLAGFIDGGASKYNLTETHVAMGTQAYMAPEQRMDAKNVDHRADIYSLGVILYELLVGEVPVGHFDPPSQRRSGLDSRLDAIVERCLKPAPADRYQKVSELIDDLLPLVPVSFSQPPRQATALQRLRWRIQRTVRATARAVSIALVLLACGVLGLSWFASPNPVASSLSSALAPELGPHGTLNLSARFTDSTDGRRVQVEPGPDQLSVVTAGRAITNAGERITFAAPDATAPVGRALLDLTNQGGQRLELAAFVTSTPEKPGRWARLKAWLHGQRAEARSAAALILQGTPGRYAAVILDGTGGPARLEWAFGERRGAMIGERTPSHARLELEIDRNGELRAFVGGGADRRQLAEPITLGAGWHRFFGKTPSPELACLDGDCEISGLEYSVHHDPPPTPPVPEPVKPKLVAHAVAKPAAHKPPRPAKLSRPVKPHAKKPVAHPASKRTTHHAKHK